MRLSRTTDNRRPTARPRARPAALPQVPPGPTPRTRGTDPLAAERRLRSSGGPVDNATYGCGCGYVFEAPVSTGVTCPHCGTGQAW
ncbi:hypothetical protein DSM112329_03627 [Paraconexibacter sp. AEG42_29]|uniref:Rubredoxin-like domain-containing protein n=1 Tax=Paraconexibacter sp. AEG42_29 TaxID=2997339 RepID=A0AAU7AYP9_9ACTN